LFVFCLKNLRKQFKSADYCLIVLLLPNSLIIAIFMTIAHILFIYYLLFFNTGQRLFHKFHKCPQFILSVGEKLPPRKSVHFLPWVHRCHVVCQVLRVGNASILTHNLPAINGFIHVIDRVQDDRDFQWDLKRNTSRTFQSSVGEHCLVCVFVCLFVCVCSGSGSIALRSPPRPPLPDGLPQLLLHLHSVQALRSGRRSLRPFLRLNSNVTSLFMFQCECVCVCVCVCVFTVVQSVRWPGRVSFHAPAADRWRHQAAPPHD